MALIVGQILNKLRALWNYSAGVGCIGRTLFSMSDQVNLRLLSAARQVDGAWVAGALAPASALLGGEGAADPGRKRVGNARVKLGDEEN